MSRWLSSLVAISALCGWPSSAMWAEDAPFALGGRQSGWVEATLRALSVREKVGQMIMVAASVRFFHERDPRLQEYRRLVREDGVTGFVLYGGEPLEVAWFTNALQRVAKVPLVFAADFEQGLWNQIPSAVSFPSPMGIAAGGHEDYALFQGEVVAQEARAIGVSWIFAPVMDVTNNPANPIINYRSYGSRPELVARMGAAFIRSAQAHGVLATAKHFPGHGNTATDSHVRLPIIPGDREALERVELVPFRAAIRAGVGAIMIAHVSVPQLTGEPGVPASLSSRVVTDLLRRELGFEGVVVTDSMAMGAITNAYTPEEAAERAVRAGCDVIVNPPDPRAVIEHLVRLVERGEISQQRIDASVRRILRAKAWLGLWKQRFVDLQAVPTKLGDPELKARSLRYAQRTVTLLKGSRAAATLVGARHIAVSVLTDDGRWNSGEVFQRELARRFPDGVFIVVDERATPELLREAVMRAVAADRVVCAIFTRVTQRKESIGLLPHQATFLRDLIRMGKDPLVVSFGNPYLVNLLPEVNVFVATFSPTEVSQIAAAQAVAGEIGYHGRSPVDLGIK